jgi:hypothetical protein
MASKKRQIGEPQVSPRRMIRAGRQTVPRGAILGSLPYNYLPRRAYESFDVAKMENSYLNASALLALLPDLNPDVGLAVWNILRLGSAGFNYTVKDNNGQDDEVGKGILDEIMDGINERGGGLPGLLVQWLQCGFLQGAIAGEVALTQGLNGVEDFYVIDPATIKFSRDSDRNLVMWHIPPTGTMLKIEMNPEKSWYIPIDPWVDDPYGRPPAAPALQEVWFDISVITDLRKVVHNQGWPRIDIKVVMEILLANAPTGIKADPQKLTEWVNDKFDEITKAYDELEPDDSYIHADCVEVNQSAGSGKLFDAGAVVRVIERRMIKALKQLPILMASNEGVTETHGTVQWQIYVAGLKSLQNPIAFIMERMMQLSLEVLGYQGKVDCWFEPIRTTDRQADAVAEGREIQNSIEKWAAGFQTWEESSIEVTGSGPPDGAIEPDPLLLLGRGAAMSAPLSEPLTRLSKELQLYPGFDDDGD